MVIVVRQYLNFIALTPTLLLNAHVLIQYKKDLHKGVLKVSSLERTVSIFHTYV